MFPRRISLFAVLFILAAPAAAEIFERDFVPGSGDGLLTYDNVNQREWLDVTVFAGQWTSDATYWDAWADPDFDFAQEFPELGTGGLYNGFTLATSDDVIRLAESGGIDPESLDYDTNGTATSAMLDLLGVVADTPSIDISVGFVQDFETLGAPYPPSVRVSAEWIHIPDVRAGLVLAYFDDNAVPETTGLMLYRVVPEPTGMCLLLSMTMCLFSGGFRNVVSRFDLVMSRVNCDTGVWRELLRVFDSRFAFEDVR